MKVNRRSIFKIQYSKFYNFFLKQINIEAGQGAKTAAHHPYRPYGMVG